MFFKICATRNFFSKELLLQQVTEEFIKKVEKLEINDRFFDAKKENLIQENGSC